MNTFGKIGLVFLGLVTIGYFRGPGEELTLPPVAHHQVKPKPKAVPKPEKPVAAQQPTPQPEPDPPVVAADEPKPKPMSNGCMVQAEDGSWVSCDYYSKPLPRHKKKKKRKRKRHYYNLDRGYSMDQEDASVREFGDHSKAYVDTGNDDDLPYVIKDTWNYNTTKKSWLDYAK